MTVLAGGGARGSRVVDAALWTLGCVGVAAVIGVTSAEQPVAAIGLLAVPLIAAIVLRPHWLPVVLLVTIFAEGLSLGGVTVSRLAGPFVLLVVLLRLVTGHRASLPGRWLLTAVGAYVVFAFASLLWTVNPNNGFGEGGTAQTVVSLALSLAYLAAFATLIDSRRDLERLGVTVWLVAVPIGIVAIAQYLGGAERAVGATGDANYFAARQVVALPICLLVASRLRGSKAFVVYIGIGVVVGSVMVSLSRGGLLALFAVFVLLLAQPARLLFANRAQKGLAIGAAVVGAAVLLYASYDDIAARGESLFTTREGGSGRENLWRAARSGWETHQVRGIGYGAFPSQSNDLLRATPGVDFAAYELRPEGQVAHSMYLGTLAEIGLVGLALLLGLVTALLMTLRSVARTADARGDPFLTAVARTLLVSLAGFLLASLFLSSETDRLLWVMIGVVLALTRLVDRLPTTGSGNLAAPGRP